MFSIIMNGNQHDFIQYKPYIYICISSILIVGDEMKTNIYFNNEKFIAGITLKDNIEPENNNMALHTCINSAHVLENRSKLVQLIGCNLDDMVCANQTHSANFHKVTVSDKGKGAHTSDSAIPNTDALYTFEPNLLLCSFSADCVPVIFCSEVDNLVGVIHSGWQGTVKEISLKVLQHIIQVEKVKPHNLYVHIGPALSQEKFEVDEDVYVKFKQLGYTDEYMYFKHDTNKYHIDNQLSVKRQCQLAGVPSNNITIDRSCTFISTDGFSYRQDKKTGRHMSFIMRK